MNIYKFYIGWYGEKLIKVMDRHKRALAVPADELNSEYYEAYQKLRKELLYYGNMYLKLIVYEGFYCDGGCTQEQYAKYGRVESSPAFKSRTDSLMETAQTALVSGDIDVLNDSLKSIRAEVAVIIQQLGGYEGKEEAAIIAAVGK